MRFFLLLLCLLFAVGLDYGFSDESRIIWNENRPIEWNDFEGVPDVFPKSYDGEREGKIAFYWGYLVSGDYQVEKVESIKCQYQIKNIGAHAEFSKNESWFKPGLVDDLTLEHEKGHFNITEIYARKYQNELLYTILPCPNNVYDERKIYDELDKLINETNENFVKPRHREYDKLTHENNFLIETKQEKQTAILMQELEKYGSIKNQYFEPELTPLKQIKNNSSSDVRCKTGWFLAIHYVRVACVTPVTYNVLLERGWIVEP